MSLIIDGTNIPNSGDYVIFDNTKLDKVICDGVVVWEKQKDITMTPTNYGGLSVTGKWSGDYYSRNGNLDGTVYSLTTRLDLTQYRKISVEVYAWCKVSINNTGSITVSINAGSKKTSRELAYAYKEDDGSNGHTEKAETVTITLDVSQLTGKYTFFVEMKVKHTTNQLGEGNSWGGYNIRKIQFLT